MYLQKLLQIHLLCFPKQQQETLWEEGNARSERTAAAPREELCHGVHLLILPKVVRHFAEAFSLLGVLSLFSPVMLSLLSSTEQTGLFLIFA